MHLTTDPFQISTEERQRYKFTSEIASAFNEMVWTAEPDGHISYYNWVWFKYTGLSLDQTKGAGWISVVHPGDVQTCIERWTYALVTGDPYKNELRLLRADGSYRWHAVQAIPVRNSRGKIIKWFGMCRDIEDQVREQKAIQDGYERHKQKLQARILELEQSNARLMRANAKMRELMSELGPIRLSPLGD